MLEEAKRYLGNKLIRAQEERGRDEPPTIIPLPSEKAQAADGQPDPQEMGEIQGNAGHASAAQRWWCFQARRLVANRKPEKRWDWSEFKNVREKFTPEERLERTIARYRKEKLLSGQHTQIPDHPATIIPFPLEQVQAAGKPAAPSSEI